MMSKKFAALIFTISIAVLGTHAHAQKNDKGKQIKAAVNRVDKSSDVVRAIMRVAEKSIPRDLIEKAKAVVVFPGAIKGAFIVGGQVGSGVAIRRTDSGWSAPAFLNMAGGSFGPQIGGQKTDYVLLIMNEKGLANLLKDRFEIGGEGSVSAGPVGRTASASTNVTLDAEILSYSRSKGLFAGLALKGVVITQDQELNQAVYEKSAREILGNPPVESDEAPRSLQKLADTVAVYAR